MMEIDKYEITEESRILDLYSILHTTRSTLLRPPKLKYQKNFNDLKILSERN